VDGDTRLDTYRRVLAPSRVAKIEHALIGRTRDLVLLLENVQDAHNLSAVLRTADAFGVQEVHVVDRTGDFVVSRFITQGCHKWLEGEVWEEPEAAVSALHARGYALHAAVLAEDSQLLPELELPGRVALVFGNEKEGLSDDLVRLCDGTFMIPMRGFSQSLNVSVSVAVTLQHARSVRDWPELAPNDLADLRLRWYQLAVKQTARIARALDQPPPVHPSAWARCKESDR